MHLKKENTTSFITNFLTVCSQKKNILISTFVVILGLASIFSMAQPPKAYMTLTFNYAGSSHGLNPNGSRFNISEITDTALIEQTLKDVGLDETCNVQTDILPNLSVRPAAQNQSRIATTYKVVFDPKSNITGVSSYDFLKFLYDNYYKNFQDKYCDNSSILKYDINTEGLSYLDTIELLNLKTNEINKYLKDRVKEDNTYKSTLTGYDFKSLQTVAQNLSDIQLKKLSSYVIENGLTTDKTETEDLLQYRNYLLNMDYQTNMICYGIRKDAIQSYDEEMSAAVLVPSLDQNNEYYMSKTKIGIDYLATDADYFLSESNYYFKTIDNNKYIIENLDKNNTEATRQTADQLIRSIESELQSLSEKAISTDTDYIHYKTKDYMSADISAEGYLTRANVKANFALAVLVTMFIAFVFTIKSRFVITLRKGH